MSHLSPSPPVAEHSAAVTAAGAPITYPAAADPDLQSWQYESILSTTDDFAYLFDLEGRFQYANRRLLEVWGRTLPEIIGKDCYELGYPEWHADMHMREIREVIATKRPIIGEVPFTAVKTGHFGVYEYVFSPVFGPDGEVCLIVGTTRDVTARRQAEDALRASEVRFRFLSELGESTRDLRDPGEIMVVVARKLGEHLGVSRCTYAEVEPDGDTVHVRHDYTRGCASTVGTYSLARFGVRPSGERAFVINDVDAELTPESGAADFNAIGIKALVCCPLVKHDRLCAMVSVQHTAPRRWTPAEIELIEAVVERFWADIERARAERVVAQREAQLRHLADAMPQMVWAARPDGVLDYTNRRWYAYIGKIEAEIGPDDWALHVHPDDLPRIAVAWAHAVASGDPYNIEFRLRRADGVYHWFLVRALAIRDAAGTINRWYGTCTDINDQRDLIEQNARLLTSERAARTEAERASRMKDEFLATLSHELRTPLNAILGWAQVLRGMEEHSDEIAQGLATIERNARAQTQIIEDLLDMSRIISGKVRLDVQRVELAGVVEAAIETVKPAADAKGIRLQVVLDTHAQPVSGDPGRLQQVFWNLLSNAIKFTPKEGRVQVLLERVNSHLEVSIVDTGEGISAGFLPHVFDRFRQADASSSRRHGGLGLGLAIVKQLVELHGGAVRVKSPGAGQGSTFIVMLPLTAVHADALGGAGADAEKRHPAAVAVAVPAHGLKPHLDGVKIVVVDDEADARALIKRLLEDRAAQVWTAGSAAEAFALVETHGPDVLVSDIGMPGEDGYALIRRVRALGGKTGSVPAVALTAYARSEDRMKAILSGFQMHIAKPVETAELLTMVASLAGRTG